MIALIGKRSPADIHALLAHVTAFDTCALVNSGLVDKVGGDYVYMQGGADMKDGMPRELVTSRKRG
jgi:hypothetical protein